MESTRLTRPKATDTGSPAGTSRQSQLGLLLLGLALASIALAVASLLLPGAPSYDPWAWIIWGREIVHLNLSTATGPSWKPLPVLFTVPFSLFGSAAPDLWLVVARAGAIASIGLSSLLAVELLSRTFPARPRPAIPAIAAAGLVAAAGPTLMDGYLRSCMLGGSEGLVNAAVLAAVACHLNRMHRRALLLGVAAALLRPEVWPFLGAYGIWLWVVIPELRRLLVGCAVLIPALWLIPEQVGSGNLFRAADRAQQPNQFSATFTADPFAATLREARNLLPALVKALAALAVPVSIWAAWRRRPALAAVLTGGLAWILLIAAMTAAGFAGNPRYLMLGAGLLAVAGGVGAGSVSVAAGLLASKAGARAGKAAEILAAVGLLVVLAVGSLDQAQKDTWRRDRSLVRAEGSERDYLPDAISLAGGKQRISSCGAVTGERFRVPMIAWYLGTHLAAIGSGSPVPGTSDYLWKSPAVPGTTFQLEFPHSLPNPVDGPPNSKRVGRAGPWVVQQACALN